MKVRRCALQTNVRSQGPAPRTPSQVSVTGRVFKALLRFLLVSFSSLTFPSELSLGTSPTDSLLLPPLFLARKSSSYSFLFPYLPLHFGTCKVVVSRLLLLQAHIPSPGAIVLLKKKKLLTPKYERLRDSHLPGLTHFIEGVN